MRKYVGDPNCSLHGEKEIEEVFTHDLKSEYHYWCPGCIGRCKVCGHKPHAKGECRDWGLIPGCICMSCNGTCTCDGESWEYDDSEPRKAGGRYKTPDET